MTFLEGIVSFLSPCMLPMLPVYISYFAGGNDKKRLTFTRALMFVAGFTAVFCTLGVFAGTLGALLGRHKTAVNICCGALVALFGLSCLNIVHLNFLHGLRGGHRADGLLSAFVFGVVYSLSLTPCVGAFLGSALMMAATAGGAVKGLTLLAVYSLGLGLPFVLSAVLIDKLGNAFAFIKRHYGVINTVCGILLIAMGVCMAFGLIDRWVSAAG